MTDSYPRPDRDAFAGIDHLSRRRRRLRLVAEMLVASALMVLGALSVGVAIVAVLFVASWR